LVSFTAVSILNATSLSGGHRLWSAFVVTLSSTPARNLYEGNV
jgi:hypothetical protein